MLNPITAAVFYTIEMLISYMFFSGTTEMKRSRGFVILTGFIIFQTGAAVNMAFNSDIFINTEVVVEARYQKVEIEKDGTVHLTIIPGKVKTIKL